MLKRAIGVLALSLLATGMCAVPASADILYPSSCFAAPSGGNGAYSLKQYWYRRSCWMGGQYLTQVTASDDSIRLPQEAVYWSTLGQCSAGTIDGAYGPATTAAVKCYQSKRALTVDGVIGTNTWSTLANDMTTTQCLGTPTICDYAMGHSQPYLFQIGYGDANNLPVQDWFCTSSLDYLVTPFVGGSSTGKLASQCPGES